MIKAILTLNVGSSSVKFAIYKAADLSVLCRGQMTSIGSSNASKLEGAKLKGAKLEVKLAGKGVESILVKNVSKPQHTIDSILNWIEGLESGWQLVGVGHRVVHGGADQFASVLIDENIFLELKLLEPLAPLHQAYNLAAIESVSKINAKLPQVACFDTAFHATQGAVQRLLPLPKKYRDKGLMRYGFHGLSYAYLIEELAKENGGVLPNKVIIAHLGNGASACAIKAGKSVSSTMSFSTLDGLLMGSRCGSIDAGALLYLLQSEGLSVDELATCLYEESGLLGLSNISSDVRVLEQSDAYEAKLALEYYVDAIVKNIAALATTLEGIDTLVLSGGVGENSVFIRRQILTKLKWLGVAIDFEANQSQQKKITSAHSAIQVFVIKTDEELIIARHTKSHINTISKNKSYNISNNVISNNVISNNVISNNN